MDSFDDIMDSPPSRSNQHFHPFKWSPPPLDSFKINVDGCFKAKSNFASISDYCKDSQGSIVFDFAKQVYASFPLVCKDLAIREACLLGVPRINSPFIVESDS